ncbi:MAG: hypothetical protein KatS3mg031_2258 [Chitinophagales bacterium]|nr:MAG: hypothetical protein KatS3mg031_2258 [Chitinophagales bacterium]
MNYRSIVLSLLFAASFHPLQGQFACWVESNSRNTTFPYVCNQDTFQIQIYTSGTVVDSMIIFWGDNTSDTISQPLQVLVISHFYQTAGI